MSLAGCARRLLPAVLITAACTASVPGAAAATPSLGPVKHVRANGLRVGYRAGGRGPWLVMVIGRTATMAEWDPQLVKQLIANHRVLVFDNRGMATTNNPSAKPVTVPLMAQDTLALASALHIDRFDLMGWSMGGEIAQQVTVDAPARVHRLVLCATSPGGPNAHLPSKPVLKLLDNPDLSTTALFALSFPPTRAGVLGAFSYSSRVYAQFKLDHLPSDSFTVSKKARRGQNNAAKQWRSKRGGVYSDLPKVQNHVLIMWGNLDIVEPTYNDRLILSLLPHVRSQVFKGAGHGFLFQDAVSVGQAADRFLG